MSAAEVSVLVVDDQELVRAGLRALLDRVEDIDVVAEAVDGVEAVAMARELRPRVVLMDIRMPRLDGIEATRRIVGDPDLADTKVLVLTTFDTEDNIVAALRAGAAGFVTKDSRPEVLRDAVRVVAAGEAILSPSVTTAIIGRVVRSEQRETVDSGAAGRVGTLTDREREVLLGVAQGLTNDEIAQRLVVSPASARTYVSRLMTKLDARDRVALVVLAHEAGLV